MEASGVVGLEGIGSDGLKREAEADEFGGFGPLGDGNLWSGCFFAAGGAGHDANVGWGVKRWLRFKFIGFWQNHLDSAND